MPAGAAAHASASRAHQSALLSACRHSCGLATWPFLLPCFPPRFPPLHASAPQAAPTCAVWSHDPSQQRLLHPNACCPRPNNPGMRGLAMLSKT
eukprot:205032-Chlamydomonas_euryale.AAC.1